MTQQRTTVRDCDRCATRKAAVETVKFGYDGNNYEIDVCQQHADMLDREMRGWTRLAREVDTPQSSLGITDAERAFLHRSSASLPRIQRPSGPIEVVLEQPEMFDEPSPEEVWPTQAAYEAMQEHDIPWPAVVAIVRHPSAVIPSEREDVNCYLGRDVEVLVSQDHHVLGLRRRTVDQQPAQANSQQGPKKIVRKGKRGGIGNVGPREYGDVLEAIRRSDWRMEWGGKHIKLTGPEGQTATIPSTPSDYRSTLNIVSQLRALGLDLREQARQSA